MRYLLFQLRSISFSLSAIFLFFGWLCGGTDTPAAAERPAVSLQWGASSVGPAAPQSALHAQLGPPLHSTD